ncbi:hypothetical protein GCM10011586_39760 [Silvibacterium dinghuense]|nr:hypothetical protein GCM10011586_39760 [Silvibacterium dinghuense]
MSVIGALGQVEDPVEISAISQIGRSGQKSRQRVAGNEVGSIRREQKVPTTEGAIEAAEVFRKCVWSMCLERTASLIQLEAIHCLECRSDVHLVTLLRQEVRNEESTCQ